MGAPHQNLPGSGPCSDDHTSASCSAQISMDCGCGGGPQFDQGAAELFAASEGSWSRTQQLDLGSLAGGSGAGTSVALDHGADVALLGAPNVNESGGGGGVFAYLPALTVTVNVSRAYGHTAGRINLDPSSPSITYQPASAAAGVSGKLTCATSAGKLSRVKSAGYRISNCSGLTDADYGIVYDYAQSSYSVTPAGLVITPFSRTASYGSGVGPLRWHANFVSGNTADSLTFQPVCSTTAVKGSPVGSYPITCQGAVDPNYRITHSTGGLTVVKAALDIQPSNILVMHGHILPTLTWTALFPRGLGPDTLTQQPICSTKAVANLSGQVLSPAGLYTITCTGAEGSNYTIAYSQALLEVLLEPVKVTYMGPTSAAGGQTAAVSARLNSDLGSPVAGRTVAFAIGEATCSATSTGHGSAGCSLVVPSGASARTLTVVFGGDRPGANYDFAPAGTSLTLEITKTGSAGIGDAS